MIVRDFMKYVESEYIVINNTPCEVCGGHFETEDIDLDVSEGTPYDSIFCVCPDCGYEKIFNFTMPFMEEGNISLNSKDLN